MPYTHFITEERDALQSMAGMKLDKAVMAAILGKHLSSVYRELKRNSDCALYTGARSAADKRGAPCRDEIVPQTGQRGA